jgi:hypothetical protein
MDADVDASMNEPDDVPMAASPAEVHDIAASARQLRFSEDGARAADAVEALLLVPDGAPALADASAGDMGAETSADAGAGLSGAGAGAGSSGGATAGGSQSGGAASTATPVLVYARVRPLSADEIARADAVTMRVTGETTVTTTAPAVRVHTTLASSGLGAHSLKLTLPCFFLCTPTP